MQYLVYGTLYDGKVKSLKVFFQRSVFKAIDDSKPCTASCSSLSVHKVQPHRLFIRCVVTCVWMVCAEMSHRGSDFTKIMDAAEETLRQLL